MQTSLPSHPSFRTGTVHTCTRCGEPARVVLHQVRAVASGEDLARTNGAYRFTPFDGGSVAIASRHAPSGTASYFWGAELDYCGFRVVTGDALPDSLINALYRELHRWEEPTERIETFDLARFLAAGFTVEATASDGSAPILLLANGPMLRHFLATGSMPARNREVRNDLGVKELVAARQEFVTRIGALARPLA